MATMGIRPQHEALRSSVRRMRNLSWGAERMTRGKPVAIMLRGELEQLERLLAVHFALEEEGGYMTEVVSEHPELTAEVFALRAQHDVLLDELDDLLAGWCDVVAPCVDYARLSALLAMVEQHERRERVLMQMALLEDMGIAG